MNDSSPSTPDPTPPGQSSSWSDPTASAAHEPPPIPPAPGDMTPPPTETTPQASGPMPPGPYGDSGQHYPPMHGAYPIAGPGGPGAYPPPPRRSNRGWWIGGAVALLVLVLCCGCIGGFGYFVYRIAEDTEDDAREAVVTYLEDIQAERYSDAYDSLCDEVRDDQTEQEFIDEMTNRPKKFNDFEVTDTSLENGDYLVKVTLKFPDNTTDRERFDVVIEGESDLRVCP